METGEGTVPGPDPLRAVLERYPESTPPHGAAGAAVLIILRRGREDVENLLIVRATRADDPASGQIGLPGGHVDESDSTLVRTALRECEEEVGLSSTDLNGTPRFVSVEAANVFRMKVGVFAAELAPHGPVASARSPTEVAHVFWLPRSALLSCVRVPRESARGRIEVDATVFEGHVLWGFTRRVLLGFYGIAPLPSQGGPPMSDATLQPTAP